MTVGLTALVDAIRAHPGVTAKAEIGLVADVFGAADWLEGPGDDGAVVDGSLVVGGAEDLGDQPDLGLGGDSGMCPDGADKGREANRHAHHPCTKVKEYLP